VTKAWTATWRLAALLALPLLFPGHGGAQPAAGAADPESRRQALLQAEEEWLGARDLHRRLRLAGWPLAGGQFPGKRGRDLATPTVGRKVGCQWTT
jgi:hypothetical protein